MSHWKLQKMTIEKLNLVLGCGAILIAVVALFVSYWTLNYMRGRDADVDARSGYAEVHKAMITASVERVSVTEVRSQMGAYSSAAPNQFMERLRGFQLAQAHLKGQLKRVNEDPLIADLKKFLNENRTLDQWETPEFNARYEDFVEKVAAKARPK